MNGLRSASWSASHGSTAASSSLFDLEDPGRLRERQNFASREVRFGYETWHRTAGSSAYGLVGDLSLLRTDQPIDPAIERRTSFTVPSFMGIINGHMPR